MSKALITEQLITDIADSIRGKTGSTDKMTPAEMPEKINGFISLENVKDGSYLFYSKSDLITKEVMESIKNLESGKYIFGNLDGSKVELLKYLDVSKVSDFSYFLGDTARNGGPDLTLDISTWDFSKALSMEYFFGDRKGSFDPPDLKVIVGDTVNTKNVKNFRYMLYGFISSNKDGVKDFLEKLDTSSGESFWYALSGSFCPDTLDLRGWKMNKATGVNNMFPDDYTFINAEGWTFDSLSSISDFKLDSKLNYKNWTFNNLLSILYSGGNHGENYAIDLSTWTCRFSSLDRAFVTNQQEQSVYLIKLILTGENLSFDKCTSISNACYYYRWGNVNLKYVIIGNDDTTWMVTNSSKAFYGCSSLETLIIKGTNVMTCSNTDMLTNSGIAAGTGYIYVADDLVDSYKKATNWSVYADQIKPLSEAPAEPEV